MKKKMRIYHATTVPHVPHEYDPSCCDSDPKCIPYVKPQRVWVVQYKRNGKWVSTNARNSQKDARIVKSMYDGKTDYRVIPAVIQEGKR